MGIAGGRILTWAEGLAGCGERRSKTHADILYPWIDSFVQNGVGLMYE